MGALMSLTKPTIDALLSLPAEARAELANELTGAFNALDSLIYRHSENDRYGSKREELRAVISLLRPR